VTPADARALEIGRLVMQVAALVRGESLAASSTYDADRLPPGATRDAFLRRHRARVRDGVEGWTRVGAARVVTADAWAREVAGETGAARRRPLATPPQRRDAAPANDDADDALDRALGIRTTRRRA
jgi:hypothetical protein